jgi:hypothetical protein
VLTTGGVARRGMMCELRASERESSSSSSSTGRTNGPVGLGSATSGPVSTDTDRHSSGGAGDDVAVDSSDHGTACV